jgi:hypothetical protein
MAEKPEGLLTQYSAAGGGQDPSSAAEAIDRSIKFKRRSTGFDHRKTVRGSVLYVDVYQELTIGGLAKVVLAALGARPFHTIP